MCGIAGIIGWETSKEKQVPILKKIQNTLVRRGPNQQGIYTTEHAALIYTGLYVPDPEEDRQPMELKKGGYVLVYNGKLYNAQILRDELISLGHKFEGHSDTEVVLHAYIQWKEHCLNRFNGVFAFGIWENQKGRLFLARDPIGVKPLFYTHIKEGLDVSSKGVFLFASEIKGLLAHPLVKPEIDVNSIAEIILMGPGRTPGCGVFKSITEVPPGCYGFYEAKAKNPFPFKLHQYWHLEDRPHRDTFDQTVEKVRSLILDSIEGQLISDVPAGTFLSGGLDSSIISAVAANRFRQEGKILDTFSVDYKYNEIFFKENPFQPGNDQPFIEEMVQYLGTNHHRILLDTEDLTEALYAAVDARDLPGMADIDASLLLFTKEVKEHVSVVLSGECADEIFGGYPWYRDKEIRETAGFPWAKSTEYRTNFLRPEITKGLSGYIEERYNKTIEDTRVLPCSSPLERRMKEMVNLNFKWFMQTLIDRTDRMSMYSGLEVRVPYCDYRIAEYLYTVPWEMKDYQGREKGLLRCAMEGLLPESVLWRKKSPYPKTHNPAYLASVSAKLREVIECPDSPVLQFIKKDALEDLLISEISVPWYGQLMTTPQTIAYFLQFNYWLEKYDVVFKAS